MFKKIFKIFTIISALIYLIQCGAFEPDVQKPKTTPFSENPEYEKPESYYSLKADDQASTYEGSIVIWDDYDRLGEKRKKDRESLLPNVLVLSSEAKDLEVKYKKTAYIDDQTYQLILEKEKNIARLEGNQAIKNFYTELNTKEFRKKSTEFLKSDIDAKYMEDFCSIILVERTLSKFILQNNFTSRPTVYLGCEDYYATNKIFKHESCQNNTDSKNYADCFFRAIKSNGLIFAKENGDSFNDTDFEKFLAQLDEGKTKRELIRNRDKILQGNSTAKPVQIFFKGNISISEKKAHMASAAETTLMTTIWNTFYTKDGLKNYTLHDRLFNLHYISDSDTDLSSQSIDEEGLDQLDALSKNYPKFGPSLVNYLDESKEKSTALKKEKSQLEKIRLNIAVQMETLKSNWLNKKAQGGDYIKTNQLGRFMFSDSMIKTKTIAKDTLEITLEFNKGVSSSYTGCLNTLSGASISCPYINENPTLIAELNLLSSNLKLSLTISSNQLHDFNNTFLLPNERELYKNSLTIEHPLLNRTLELDLYPRTLGGVVPSLTGNITVQSGNQVELVGSVTLTKPTFPNKPDAQ